jgi:hypothetical protein
MAKRTEYEIRRSIAQQREAVAPPTTRRWAEIERERLAAAGKDSLGPLPDQMIERAFLSEPPKDRRELEKEARVTAAMKEMFPGWTPRR